MVGSADEVAPLLVGLAAGMTDWTAGHGSWRIGLFLIWILRFWLKTPVGPPRVWLRS